MFTIGVLVLWGGYGLTSYGYVLIKGWNITMPEWFSPLHPYTWPANGAEPPTVPKGTVMPTSKGTAKPAATDSKGTGAGAGTGTLAV